MKLFGRTRLRKTSMILTPTPISWTLSLEVRLLKRPRLSNPHKRSRKPTPPKTLLFNNNLNKIRLKTLLLMSPIRNLVMLPNLFQIPQLLRLAPLKRMLRKASISPALLKRSRPWKPMRLWVRTLHHKCTTSWTKFSEIAIPTKIWMPSWSASKPRTKKS